MARALLAVGAGVSFVMQQAVNADLRCRRLAISDLLPGERRRWNGTLRSLVPFGGFRPDNRARGGWVWPAAASFRGGLPGLSG
jgi:hypothetical protein